MYEKAIRMAIRCCENIRETSVTNHITASMCTAIFALEKQIPKKPTTWGDGYAEGYPVIESYECPACGCIYDFDLEGELKYCTECGQAMDWS